MQIRPYGDTANDGMVQISFTLPLPLGARAREAARRYAMLMGISNPLVAHAESADTNFSFFVVYGACSHTIDAEQILVDELAHGELDFYAVNDLIEQQLGRRVTLIGAAIESDAQACETKPVKPRENAGAAAARPCRNPPAAPPCLSGL